MITHMMSMLHMRYALRAWAVHAISSIMEKMDRRLVLLLKQSDLDAIDEWRRKQHDIPNRSEAVRRMIRATADRQKEPE